MMTSLSPIASTDLSHAVDGASRGGINGLASPREAAGQFAAMMAGVMSGELGIVGEAAPGSVGDRDSPGASSGTIATSGEMSGMDCEQRVSGAAVSVLFAAQTADSSGSSSAALSTAASKRLRKAVEDISGQVVEKTVAAGTLCDGRWMAMLLSNEVETA